MKLINTLKKDKNVYYYINILKSHYKYVNNENIEANYFKLLLDMQDIIM